MYMGKPQTFDIIAVSIPDSNVQKAVARIMVGADRYLSMQDALDRVNSPPVLLFKNTELKDAEQHVAKLKALGVGFRIAQSDGTEDDSVISDDDLPGGAAARPTEPMLPVVETPPDIPASGNVPPLVSVQDAISHHHSAPSSSAHAHSGGATGATGAFGFGGGSGGGHGGGGHGGSGTRAGSDMLYALKKSEAAATKKKRWVSVATAAIVVIFALLFYFVPKGKKFHVSKITLPSSTAGGVKRPPSGGAGGENAADADAAAGVQPERKAADGADADKPRGNINNRQKQQASSYIDSAKSGGALDKQVAFYKIAISFNRYNLQAWHGLMQAYREMNDMENFRATEAQMQEIFGAEVKSVNAAVTQFGEIIDAYANKESGAYRVEYKTKKTSRDEILRDAFNLTRAIRNSCGCLNISVYASTGPGNGLIVHSTAATPVHTLPEFSRQANILWFD
jgi:hypothetical protein